MTRDPPKARFVPPPPRPFDSDDTVDQLLPLPETTMGCWGESDEPRDRLPPDTSYLHPITLADLQRSRRHGFWIGAGIAFAVGLIGWAVL